MLKSGKLVSDHSVLSSHRNISVAALEGRVVIHQYCAREDSMGMVSTARVTQVIQNGQCGKTESQLFGSSKSHKQAHPSLCRFISTTYTWHYVAGLYPSGPFTVHNNHSTLQSHSTPLCPPLLRNLRWELQRLTRLSCSEQGNN